jgi:hypothetical protein
MKDSREAPDEKLALRWYPVPGLIIIIVIHHGNDFNSEPSPIAIIARQKCIQPALPVPSKHGFRFRRSGLCFPSVGNNECGQAMPVTIP